MTRKSSMQVVSFSLILIVSLALSIPAFAGKGGTPSGKPFVELQGQIIEVEGEVASLQDQVEAVVGRVDTLEEEQDAIQAAISDLQAQNDQFTTQIAANAADIASIEGQITDLTADNASLQAQINANAGDILAHQTQINSNSALITSLQQTLDTLAGDLQAQIDNNLDLIEAMQSNLNALAGEMAAKQDLVAGICPDGEAINQVLSDGSVICVGPDTASSALAVYTSSNQEWFPDGYSSGVTASCLEGDLPVATGFYANKMNVYASVLNLGSGTGTIFVDNDSGRARTVIVHVTCMTMQ